MRPEAPLRTAAILATGDEITGGRTVDTNSAWIADRLAELGIEVTMIVAVGDDLARIGQAWRSSAEQADVVISTGGLGPTSDDLTNEALAAVAGTSLHLDEKEAERIRAFFRTRGRTMPENNLRQAMIPEGAEVVANPVGTAPGYRLAFRAAGGRGAIAIVLPGVPREMKAMFDQSVAAWIAARVDPARVVVSQTYSTFGLPESALDERLRGAVPPARGRLSFRASFPKISVRIGVAGPRDEAPRELETLAREVRSRIGEVVYADDDRSMEEVVGALLVERKLTLATAESCTGGLISDRITDVAGSSAYYIGGIVAYSNDLKQRLLGVRMKTLEDFGAVSEQTAREMAAGALALGADIGVATTGIAGPDGGTEAKPVGTVAIAITRRDADGSVTTDSRLHRFWGGRDWIKMLTAQVALDWVRRSVLRLPVLEPRDLAPARGKSQAA